MSPASPDQGPERDRPRPASPANKRAPAEGAEAFDPYYQWLGIPPEKQPPNHYVLLGIALFESDPVVIQTAAEQRMVHLRCFHLGPRGPLSQKLLNEVAVAKVCLRDPAKKAAYDEALRKKLRSAPAPAKPTPGRTPKQLGEYELLEKVGEGGMGAVYKARHRTMDRIVALKLLPPKSINSPELVRRFHHEVKAAAKLIHPNVVTAFDAGQQAGIHYLVMEFVDGLSLAQVLKQHGPLPLESAVDAILQAARGLQYAHSQGIIHRDVKPANLLLDKNGTVKVLDMGLARIADANPLAADGADRLTASGQVMGTCDYMAPEQALDTHQVDHRADIYSLGCTLFRLLTGNPPYRGESLAQILVAHQQAPIPSLLAARPDLPCRLEEVCRKMMAKRPEDRYASMAALAADLEACSPAALRTTASEKSVSSDAFAFLREITGPGTAVRKQALATAEETFDHQPHPETGTHIGVRLVTVLRRRKPVTVVASLALSAALLVAAGIVITIRHRDGPRTTIRVPEGSQVAISKEGQVAVDLPPQQQAPAAKPTSIPATPEAKPPAATPGPQSGNYDALSLVDVARDGVRGEWKRDGPTLSTTAQVAFSALVIPIPVTGDYDLEVIFTHHQGLDPLHVILPVGSHQCEVAMWLRLGKSQRHISLLGMIDQKLENETAKPSPPLIAEHPYNFLVKVRGSGRQASVEAFLDQAPLVTWHGDESSLTLGGLWNLPQLDRIALGVQRSLVTFHSVRLRMPPSAGISPAPPTAIAPFDAQKAREHQEAWAKHLGLPVEMTNSIGMKFVLIPPGEFDMGAAPQEIEWALADSRGAGLTDEAWWSPRTRSAAPPHRVRIARPFYLGAYPVTQAEYAMVMGSNPAAYSGEAMDRASFDPPLTGGRLSDWQSGRRTMAGQDTQRHPVETVSWDDVTAFCRRLSAMEKQRDAPRVYRLPTEAEWEYACRAGTPTRWFFGDDQKDLVQYGWFNRNGDRTTHPVGQKQPNPWGLHDLPGPVWQWCSDWFGADYYRAAAPDDPAGPPTGTERVARGGYYSALASHCRSAFRNFHAPDSRLCTLGFRVVLDVR